jgi:adenine specific DNA methylase Mod
MCFIVNYLCMTSVVISHKFLIEGKCNEGNSQTSREMKAGVNNLYGDMKGGTIGNIHGTNYDPPLPNSVIKQERNTPKLEECFGKEYLKNKPNYRKINPNLGANGTDCHIYDPPLPHSLLEIKSEKGKHATQKPTELIKWCLKYYSKEGDTVLDPTMGSGSTGVACKEMNRNFIGIELDKKIYSVAEKRITK